MADADQLEFATGHLTLRGESIGEGTPIVGLHGLTATRRYVVHGSSVLARKDCRLVTYDARGHGASDPAPSGGGYGYAELVDDLDVVLDELDAGPVILAGHSLGAHTIVAYALDNPDRVAGLVVIGPAYRGHGMEPDEEKRWLALADGLEEDGVEGFIEAYGDGLDEEWRDTLLRIARERLKLHEHPEAVAQALRESPFSDPFDDLSELDGIEIPSLVIASRDDADPGHPYGVAEAYAEHLPRARLEVEDEDESPLAWQGGKLSREIASFIEEDAVAERLG